MNISRTNEGPTKPERFLFSSYVLGGPSTCLLRIWKWFLRRHGWVNTALEAHGSKVFASLAVGFVADRSGSSHEVSGGLSWADIIALSTVPWSLSYVRLRGRKSGFDPVVSGFKPEAMIMVGCP